MEFLSGAKGLKLTLRPARTSFVELDNGQKVPRVDRGLRVRFNPLAEPIPTEAFSSKDGKARGVLHTKTAARRAGVKEEDLIEILLNHPQHGILFGRVGDRGETIVPEMLHIVPMEDGYYCELCKKTLAKQGVHNHPKSKQHREHMALIEQDTREQLEAQAS